MTMIGPRTRAGGTPDAQAFEQALVRVREQGYATTLEEVRLGSCSIAVPVFHTGRIGACGLDRSCFVGPGNRFQ